MVKPDEKSPQPPESALGYEQAREELIEVVRRLEAGGTTLEESLALWERGEELARVCRRWLDGARARLDAALAVGLLGVIWGVLYVTRRSAVMAMANHAGFNAAQVLQLVLSKTLGA